MENTGPSTGTGRVAAAAWALERLIESGLRCRADERCVGELTPRDVIVTAERGLETAPGNVRRQRRAARRHASSGHDRGCEVFGVPLATLERLAISWCGLAGARYLMEGLDEAIRSAPSHPRAEVVAVATDARELVALSLRRRITPRRADLPGDTRTRRGQW